MIPPAPHLDPRPYCWVRFLDEPAVELYRDLFGTGWVPVRSLVPTQEPAGSFGLHPCYTIDRERLDFGVAIHAAEVIAAGAGCDLAGAVELLIQGFCFPVEAAAESCRSFGPSLGLPLAALPAGR